MKLKEIIQKKNIKQKDLAQALGIDEPQMSKIINYKCLPTPVQAIKMCEFLNCDIFDIYRRFEIDIKNTPKSRDNTKDDNEYYHLCVRLTKTTCKCLKDGTLQKVGYKTIKSYIIDVLKDLANRESKGANNNEERN